MTRVTRALTASLASAAVLLSVAPAMASGTSGSSGTAESGAASQGNPAASSDALAKPYEGLPALPALPAEADEGGHGAKGEGPSWLRTGGRFAKADGSDVPVAVTYDSAVPAGAKVTVAQWLVDGRMSVRLWVDGVESKRSFGAHVHTKPCGAEPDDSGPHYQHKVDPVQPSVDPQFANPTNEIWLDFDSNARGEGRAESWQKWNFRAGQARSVVIHEHTTHTGEGHAGQAGDRLACVTVPFEPEAEAAS